MSTSQAEIREFVELQFQRELDAEGATVGAVADRLRSQLAAEFRNSIDECEAILEGKTGSSDGQLTRVLFDVRERGGRVDRAYVSYRRLAQDQRTLIAVLFGGISDMAAYLFSLILVLMVVVTVYVVFVVPQFRNLFGSMGHPLPALTRNLLEHWWTAAVILVLFLVGAGLMWAGALRLRRRLLGLYPLGRGTRGLPLVGRLVGEYDRFLWMQYLAVFLDSALPATVAGEIARTYVSAPSGSAETELVLAGAEKLGVLRETIAAQLPDRRETALNNLASIRNVGAHIVRLLIYLLIGMFVTAMYLPIFGLGALV